MKQNLEKQKDLEKNLKRYSKLKKEELFKEYNTSEAGISIVDLEERLEEYGKNTIDVKNNNTIWHRLKEAFINPFNIVLILVALVTFVTDVIITKPSDYSTFILIISTILVSATISFVEQAKSDKAAKKLQSMILNKIDVIRDEVQTIEDVENIIPGDIVKL